MAAAGRRVKTSRHMRALFLKSALFAALAGATMAFSLSTSPDAGGEVIGLEMALPANVGEWRGEPGEPSRAEKEILPPDTELAKMSYRRAGGGEMLQASLVLSGRDRTSIHRPEVCLVGQGWNIARSEAREISLQNGEKIAVSLLEISREADDGGGSRRRIRGYYAYWFIGPRSTTPDNLTRILGTAWTNVARGENPRWAYAAAMAVVGEDLFAGGRSPEETLASMEAWIAGAAPAFQRVYLPAGWKG